MSQIGFTLTDENGLPHPHIATVTWTGSEYEASWPNTTPPTTATGSTEQDAVDNLTPLAQTAFDAMQ